MMSMDEQPNLPISGAIIEIVEYFLALNKEVQYDVKSQPKQCIQIEVDNDAPHMDTKEDFSLYNLKVTQGNLPTQFDVDGFISKSIPDVLQIIPPETHRKGDPGPPGAIQVFSITCPHQDNTITLAEHHCVTRDQCGRVCTHKSSMPRTSSDEEVSVILQVVQTESFIHNVMRIIYQYLYKLKLLNPQFSLSLSSLISEEKRSWNFGEDLHGYKYHAADLKVATDIKHFLRPDSIPTHAVKIKPSVGSRYVIPSPPLWDDSCIALKVSVLASLVPPPCNQADFNNGQCTQLWISLFGPGNIPLHVGSKMQFPVDPTHLVSWEDYGLTIGGAVPTSRCLQDSSNVYEADIKYQLNSIYEEEVEEDTERPKYIVHLFIVLSRNDKTNPLASYETQDLLLALRSHTVEYFLNHKAKLSAATVSAINKILKCKAPGKNKSKTRTETVSQAIQTISKAISTVVSNSVHDDFRQQCFHHMQVDNTADLSKAAICKLWSISSRLGVKVPKEYQDLISSQNSSLQSQQESQHYLRNPQEGNDHPRRDSAYYLSPERYTQNQTRSDDEEATAEADFANLDVFPESDELGLECVQATQVDQNDHSSQRLCEPAEAEKVLEEAMGDDWFEEVLLNSDWTKQQF